MIMTGFVHQDMATVHESSTTLHYLPGQPNRLLNHATHCGQAWIDPICWYCLLPLCLTGIAAID